MVSCQNFCSFRFNCLPCFWLGGSQAGGYDDRDCFRRNGLLGQGDFQDSFSLFCRGYYPFLDNTVVVSEVKLFCSIAVADLSLRSLNLQGLLHNHEKTAPRNTGIYRQGGQFRERLFLC